MRSLGTATGFAKPSGHIDRLSVPNEPPAFRSVPLPLPQNERTDRNGHREGYERPIADKGLRSQSFSGTEAATVDLETRGVRPDHDCKEGTEQERRHNGRDAQQEPRDQQNPQGQLKPRES